MDVRSYNRDKWDKQVENGNPWTIPASPEVIAAARKGEWSGIIDRAKSCAARLVPPGSAGVGHPVPGIGRRTARTGVGSCRG